MSKKWKKYGFCLLISFVFLLLCSKCSPIYVLNDWYDANAFFTVGKSMMKGMVPYLELFEQKGPLLYLIYGVGSLISSGSFLGVFCIEVFSFSIFLYYTSKIIDLFLSEEMSYFILPVLSFAIISSRPFTHGGSAEEFLFPFLTIGLYYLVKYLKKDERRMPRREVFLLGFCAGCILWIKYSVLGLFVGIILSMTFLLLQKKEYKEFLIDIFLFLGGVALVSIPWIIYFAVNHGLDAMWNTYFLFNMNQYAGSTPWYFKIFTCFATILRVLSYYFQYVLLIFLPLLCAFFTETFWKEKSKTAILLICVLCLLFGIFIGGTNFRYYSLPVVIFMVFGIIFCIKTYTMFTERNWNKDEVILVTTILFSCSLIFTCARSTNFAVLLKREKDYAQYTFAKVIKKKPNATLLNYGFLDGGFYLTAKVYPTTYYFEKQNISPKVYPDNMAAQRDYIANGKVDFVVTKNVSNQTKTLLKRHYRLVKSQAQEYEGKKVVYYLYQKNEN